MSNSRIGNMGLLIICISIGLLCVSIAGVGGDQINNIVFFGNLNNYVLGLLIGLGSAIGVTGVLSFLSPRGVSVAAAGVYMLCMEILIGISSALFFSLPWGLGAIFGIAYVAIGTFIVFSDISELVMQGG